MTALEIIKALKAERHHVFCALLWINEERKIAAFHGGRTSCSERVDFNAALVAKSDPALGIVDETDGITYAAA